MPRRLVAAVGTPGRRWTAVRARALDPRRDREAASCRRPPGRHRSRVMCHSCIGVPRSLTRDGLRSDHGWADDHAGGRGRRGRAREHPRVGCARRRAGRRCRRRVAVRAARTPTTPRHASGTGARRRRCRGDGRGRWADRGPGDRSGGRPGDGCERRRAERHDDRGAGAGVRAGAARRCRQHRVELEPQRRTHVADHREPGHRAHRCRWPGRALHPVRRAPPRRRVRVLHPDRGRHRRALRPAGERSGPPGRHPVALVGAHPRPGRHAQLSRLPDLGDGVAVVLDVLPALGRPCSPRRQRQRHPVRGHPVPRPGRHAARRRVRARRGRHAPPADRHGHRSGRRAG